MAYFDNAATTWPKPECVYAYMDTFYRNSGGNAGRGGHALARSAGALVQEVRSQIQALLHCPTRAVILTPSSTLALNMILQGLVAMGKGSFYIGPFEHNSVTRVLEHFEAAGQITVRQLEVQPDLTFDCSRIRYQFEAKKPDVVILSHVSSVIGLVAPVAEVFALARSFRAVTVADLSQSAGLVDCPAGLETFDFAVFSGHKSLYGPAGIAGFVMKPDMRLPPVLFGGTGTESARQDMPESLPERLEAGSINVVGVAGLHAALEWIRETGPEAIRAREREHRSRLLELLGRYAFLQTVGNVPGREYVGIVSCRTEGIAVDAAAQLLAERGIAVRSGLHCAPLAHRFLGTFPDGTVRFSTGYFNDEADFAALEQALEDMKRCLPGGV